LLEEFGVEPDPETRKLARKIQAARKGESHETPPVVKPLPATSSIAARAVQLDARPARRSRMRTTLAVGVVIAIIAVIAFLANDASSEGHAGDRSVAVVPFRVIGTPSPREIADAIAEALTTALATDTTVTVRAISRELNASVASDLPRLGRQLGVAYIVDGSVQRSGGEVRVTLRLLRVSDAAAVWAGSHDIADGDPATIARRVASDAVPTITKSLATASPVKR
jgi:TolB-like protein